MWRYAHSGKSGVEVFLNDRNKLLTKQNGSATLHTFNLHLTAYVYSNCIFLSSVFLPFGEIKKYLDEAEEDKKRYIEELKIYQQSAQYQAFVKRQSAKKMKNIVGKEHLCSKCPYQSTS